MACHETWFPRLIRKLEQHRKSRSNFFVWVPGLNLKFLGDRTGGRFTLIPIEDNGRFGLIAGDEQQAQDVFAKLARRAKILLDEEKADEGSR